VATVEHGTHLDDEAAQAMAETGAVLVPTATFIAEVLAEPDALPPHARAKLRAVGEVHQEAVGRAHLHGVRIAAGTDIGRSGEGPASWGHHGHEPALLTAAGLSPLKAIEAATVNGPLTLGPKAPRTGRLAPGHDADIVKLDADPLADIKVLADPTHVTGVS
jgi:imidazolonepropionase-like amidohydrolase